MPISLIIRPVNTNQLTFPKDLLNLPIDDPKVVDRFAAYLDSLASRSGRLQISTIYIGNEIDAYLEEDPEIWHAFMTFFEKAKDQVKKVFGSEMKVGTIGQLDALINPATADFFKNINKMTDMIGVTYYPLNDKFQVRDPKAPTQDFSDLVKAYPNKPIYFNECGYPTSPINKSSEEQQRDFIKQVFKAWDKHDGQIMHIDFTWMHDLSASSVNTLKEYYGVQSEEFGEYLRTLGFRTFEGYGRDKLGFIQLKEELEKRGW